MTILHYANRNRKNHTRNLIVGAALLGIVGAVAPFVAYAALHRSAGSSLASSLGVKREAGFSIENENDMDSTVMWTITNRAEEPLTITGVRLNNEFDAKPMLTFSQHYGSLPPPVYPIQISIGATAHFKQRFQWNGYVKDVIFVDIETDRGSFRWKDRRLEAR